MALLDQPAPRGLPSFTNCVRAFEEELDYLTRCLRRHGVTGTDAEDLVQDVFVVMCRRWGDFRPDRPLRPWLAGIAFHVAKSHLRRHGREVPKSDIDLEDARPVAEDRLMSEGARQLVLKVLSSLPERHRTALVMHDLDEMAVPEIAQTLGIPLASAYTRIRRARIAFADSVKRQEQQPAGTARAGTALGVEALFAIERKPPAVATTFRQRAVAQVRATAAEIAAGRWPGGVAHGRAVPVSIVVRIAEGVGLATLVAAAGFFVWLLARPPGRPAGMTGDPGLLAGAAVTGLPLADPAAPVRGAASKLRSSSIPRLTVPPTVPPGAGLSVGLGGYWRFDDGHGSRVARDVSGHRRDCHLNRMKVELGWVESPQSGGLSLGPGGWLGCPLPPVAAVGAEVSAALWIRIDQLRKYHGTLLVRQLASQTDDLFYFGVLGSDLVLRSKAWQPDVVKAPIPNPVGRWIHVAFSRRSDGITKLFVDGVVAAEQRASAVPVGPASGPLLVGAAFRPSPRHKRDVVRRFSGAIDEVLIYDRALGDEEVAVISAGVSPSFEGGQVGPVGAN